MGRREGWKRRGEGEKLTIKERQWRCRKTIKQEEEAEEEEEETTTYLLRAGQKVSWSLDVDSKGSLPSPENTNKPHFRRPSTTHPLQHRKYPETVSKPKRQHWRNVCEVGLSNYGFSWALRHHLEMSGTWRRWNFKAKLVTRVSARQYEAYIVK